jgi:hypothetical protein
MYCSWSSRETETGIITQEHTVWCCRSRRLSGMPFKAASTIGSPYGCHSHFGHAGGKRETIATRVGKAGY